MPALVAGNHVFLAAFSEKTSMAGTSAGMTAAKWFGITGRRSGCDIPH
jgi:hypothetical protein